MNILFITTVKIIVFVNPLMSKRLKTGFFKQTQNNVFELHTSIFSI